MIIFSKPYKYIDGTAYCKKDRNLFARFTTNNFFKDYWPRTKETFAKIDIWTPNAAPEEFHTNSEEIMYIQHQEKYWKMRACDIETFMKSADYSNRFTLSINNLFYTDEDHHKQWRKGN